MILYLQQLPHSRALPYQHSATTVFTVGTLSPLFVFTLSLFSLSLLSSLFFFFFSNRKELFLGVSEQDAQLPGHSPGPVHAVPGQRGNLSPLDHDRRHRAHLASQDRPGVRNEGLKSRAQGLQVRMVIIVVELE